LREFRAGSLGRITLDRNLPGLEKE